MKPNQTRGEEQKQLIFQPGSVIWYLWTKDKDKIKSSTFIPQCFTCKELDIDVFAPQQIPLRICLEDSHRYNNVFGLSGPWKVVERSGCYLRPAQVCQQIPGDSYGYLKGWHENEPYPMYQHACGECICIRNAMMYGWCCRTASLRHAQVVGEIHTNTAGVVEASSFNVRSMQRSDATRLGHQVQHDEFDVATPPIRDSALALWRFQWLRLKTVHPTVLPPVWI